MSPFSLVPIASVPPDAVEALLDRAFEPARRQRTAYKVRGDAEALAALSFAAVTPDGALAGSVQCWPVSLATDEGAVVPMVMLGPVAVVPELQGSGLGRALTEHALDAADAAGLGAAVMLIGDPDYYGRFFGFSAERTGRWRLPGPVEAHRLLARGDDVPDVAGVVGPRVAVTA
jgi:predicted N-acetyltransferase YhbS